MLERAGEGEDRGRGERGQGSGGDGVQEMTFAMSGMGLFAPEWAGLGGTWSISTCARGADVGELKFSPNFKCFTPLQRYKVSVLLIFVKQTIHN